MYDKTKINTRQFIILGMRKNTGEFSISPTPKIHDNYPSALHEAQRLASIHTDKKFLVVGVAAVAELRPISNPVITTYSISGYTYSI